MKNDKIVIANKKFNSRLIVGTGKYKSMPECAKAIKLSGAEIVTVAVRRVNISDKNKPLLMDYIDPKKITYLPNTAGCFNSKEALRTLRLAREIGGWKLVKLEVLGDKKNLFPDMIETLKSTEVLSKEGFKVMVYCTDDPLMAKRLEDVGACAIMPLAAPIGSGLGIQNQTNIKIIRRTKNVVNDVFIVLLKVEFKAPFITSRTSFFLFILIYSRTRSKTTTVSFNEYPIIVRSAAINA